MGVLNKARVRVVAVLVGCLLSASTVWAQASAQISGTVRDESGAVVPGVQVTATQTETGIARTAVTNAAGSYVMPNLSLGPYRLEAKSQNFATFAQTGIVLQVNASAVIDPVMKVGQTTEQVEVTADAGLVETRNQGVSQVIQTAQILELPLNGRSVTDLIGLTPTAVNLGNAGGGYIASFIFNTNTTLSLAGGATLEGLYYQLDGASHNNPQNAQNMSMPFPDALQEFRVETSATGAQAGVHASGSVTLVTKSGTNGFHGDLFEFIRNYKFNARNTFAPSRDTLKRNQFGGTLGGPIIKNKLFFFGGYQGTTIRAYPQTNINFVPSTAMRAGDFTAAASPACNGGRQISLRAPFVNNQISPALFSSVINNLENLSIFPKTSDPCGRFVWGNPDIRDPKFPLGRVDYQFNASHSMFGRYMAESLVKQDPFPITKDILSVDGTQAHTGLEQAFTYGDTYTFSSNIVNAFRLLVTRTNIKLTNPEIPSWASLGANVYEYQPTYLITDVTGGFNVATIAYGGLMVQKNATFGLSDDLNVLVRNHQISLGFSAMKSYQNQFSPTTAPGSASFNGQTSGLPLADFLMGSVSFWQQSGLHHIYGKQRYFGLYATDTWKATKKLTFNFGLRWDPYFPFQWTDGTLYNFSLSDLQKGIKTTQYLNAPPGLSYPGDSNYPNYGEAHGPIKWTNFSPRVGLAWDVTGDGRTSVRAAVGTFYDLIPYQWYCCTSYSPPFLTYLFGFSVNIANPWSAYPEGNPFPAAGQWGSTGKNTPNATFPTGSSYFAYDPNVKYPNTQHWDLSIQRQIRADWLVSASYIGNHSIHQWANLPLNPAVYIPGASCVLNGVTYNPCSSTANTQARRLIGLQNPQNPQIGQQYGLVYGLDSGITSGYNGLVLTAQRRFTRGVSVNANYTWSHCIGIPAQGFTTFGNAISGIDPNNRNYSRGNCDSDRRHIFNLTAALETPRFSNRTLQAVATGWKVAPILRIQSGPYLTATTSQDIALNSMSSGGAQAGQHLSQVLPNVYGNGSASNYLNPAAFARPQTGTFGNMGARSVLGPNYWTLDMALSRVFRIRESQSVEIRGEAFNITNSVRLNVPTTVFESATFGQILSAQDPRIMQFAIKYVF